MPHSILICLVIVVFSICPHKIRHRPYRHSRDNFKQIFKIQNHLKTCVCNKMNGTDDEKLSHEAVGGGDLIDLLAIVLDDTCHSCSLFLLLGSSS
jgi:hypothetical protein